MVGIQMTSMMLVLGKRILALIAMFIRHPVIILQIKKISKNKKNVKKSKPVLSYELPDYKANMKHCTSNQKYLRPVRLCNTNAPEIIAMANKLGAYQVNKRSYAENVFHFVKNNIKSTNRQIFGSVKTLKEGYGSCFDAVNLFITLCRCGGVRARYKIYLHNEPPEGFNSLSESMGTDVTSGMAILTSFYTVAEVNLDGKWIECEVSSNPELDAYWNVPIARFGENCGKVGGWFPDDVLHLEKLPYRIIIPTNFLMKLTSDMLHEINSRVEKEREEGRRKLEKIGRENYDKKARRRYGYFPSLED